MALVTYEMAAEHLRLPLVGSPHDSDLETKIEQASAMVLLYLDTVVPSPPWTVDSDPAADPEFAIVQAAVLLVIGNLYRFRGDDDVVPRALAGSTDPIDPAAKQLLSLLRPPVYA